MFVEDLQIWLAKKKKKVQSDANANAARHEANVRPLPDP